MDSRDSQFATYSIKAKIWLHKTVCGVRVFIIKLPEIKRATSVFILIRYL